MHISALYESVTNSIIADLESGVAPWVKPWKTGNTGGILPMNASTKRSYNGINIPILWHAQITNGYRTASWMTYRQALELGAQVRGGEKSTHVVFTKQLNVKDKETDEEKKIGMLKAYSVFNVAQIDRLPSSSTGQAEKTPDQKQTMWTRLSPRPKLTSALVETAHAMCRRSTLSVCRPEARSRAENNFWQPVCTNVVIMPNQVLCRADLDSRARRDQTGVAMRHNQSDSRKLSRASSGLYRPGRDVVDATRARAFSLRRMSVCM
jgi:hypothetical protein